MIEEEFAPIKVTQGTYVEVELISESGQQERLAFDLVPDADADLADGLAGRTIAYNRGDIRAVRLLKVTYSRRDLAATHAAANRQAALRKAINRSDLAEAVRFASTVNQKWGDYDPEGIVANWEEDLP
jgi:hypothetical protein